MGWHASHGTRGCVAVRLACLVPSPIASSSSASGPPSPLTAGSSSGSLFLSFTDIECARDAAAGHPVDTDEEQEAPGRYDQDYRFGSVNLKGNFFLVKFLEDAGYQGSRHFDAHAYRTEDYEGVKDFARGCIRTYLILKEKGAQWNADPEIRALLAEIAVTNGDGLPAKFSPQQAGELLSANFDRAGIAARGLKYERLDQLTIDILLGVR